MRDVGNPSLPKLPSRHLLPESGISFPSEPPSMRAPNGVGYPSFVRPYWRPGPQVNPESS